MGEGWHEVHVDRRLLAQGRVAQVEYELETCHEERPAPLFATLHHTLHARHGVGGKGRFDANVHTSQIGQGHQRRLNGALFLLIQSLHQCSHNIVTRDESATVARAGYGLESARCRSAHARGLVLETVRDGGNDVVLMNCDATLDHHSQAGEAVRGEPSHRFRLRVYQLGKSEWDGGRCAHRRTLLLLGGKDVQERRKCDHALLLRAVLVA
mmetsp:Transcript_23452/g.69075  ORF Transcript_23452/g.69075 Transcript_23452/m.69075 type:complete len:211 (+) Transcript_23452:1042-1674(+)